MRPYFFLFPMLLVRRFANQRARAGTHGRAFQHAIARHRSRARANDGTHGTALTCVFAFFAVFEHCTRACANHGTAHG